ncbi:MmcQ/YjbR family DNA-binding protein [Longispora sp. NPDC051575]|uniref:MmcQ/YjbR family DNA-binding protein n=1 Tax=Longispora sp. NPDC051575 TaxID=3154943 RepID=UPI003444F08B
MASWDDVRHVAAELPETVEQSSSDGSLAWKLRDKLLAWERPLRRVDREALGDAAPDGPILAARVPDVGAKEALIAESPEIYFTTPHFDGYPAILLRLDRIEIPELRELLTEAWFLRAPKRLAAKFRADNQPPE